MPMNNHLKVRLELVADRRRRWRLWWSLAACWAGAALAGLGLGALQQASGWMSSLGFPMLALASVAAAVVIVFMLWFRILLSERNNKRTCMECGRCA